MSPVSKGRKPKKRKQRPVNQNRARPPTDLPAPKDWPELLREPVELSGCLLQSEPDDDTVTLAATLTGGGRSVGIEVFVIEDTVEEIEVHRVPSGARALRRRTGLDLTEAELSPDEFRRQVEAAMVIYADTVRFCEDRYGHSPPERDLPERMAQLRRWLGLPQYEGLPRVPPQHAVLLPLTLPPPGPVTGLRLAVGIEALDPAVWRRLEVRSDVTLAELHRILTVAFDREPDEKYEFRSALGVFGKRDGSGGLVQQERPPGEATLGQVAPGPGHRLQYDVAGWDHWIRVEQVVAVPVAPRCVVGERAAPPDGCRDQSDYDALLEAIEDPDDEYNEDVLDELGVRGGFDPKGFSAVFTSLQLADLS